jgi:hypothetical protein
VAELTVTKIAEKSMDILFICALEATRDDLDMLRTQFEEAYPGIKAIFLNYAVEVCKIDLSGVTNLTINCPEGVTTEIVQQMKPLLKDAIRAVNKKPVQIKSRYVLIKES